MRRGFGVIAAAVVAACGLYGCASATSSEKLTDIRLGMNKGEVRSVLGHPAAARGSIKNKYGQVIEVWEYVLVQPSTDTTGQVIGKSALTVLSLGIGAASFKGERRNYWLYFLRDELVQWGEAGDWSREPDRIYQFNFQPQIQAD